MSHQSELISTNINEYLAQHERKELLRLLTCGSVDDGKSTLIGRLLHDSKMIYEDHMEALKKDSVKSGTTGEKVDLALLVDGLQAEREQGITIDVAYRYFSTAKRKFIIADTPGHEQYTRNMATGASTANLAIILIDARHGVLTQTRRHSFIASLLGIQHIVVAINKMDLVEFSESRFNEIKAEYEAFSAQLNLHDIRYVPISALDGDNVVNKSEKTPWFSGESLMEILENVEIAADRNFDHFRFPVQYVNRPNLDFRGFCGTVASGVIKKGDTITALPSGKSSKVKDIVTFDGSLDEAFVDQAVTLTLEDEIDISRGDMIIKPDDLPNVSNSFDAHIVWMNEDEMKPGKLYNIKLASNAVSGSIKQIHHQIDINTLAKHDSDNLHLNEIGLCQVNLNQPVAFDKYDDNRATGAFVVIDRLTNITVGAGMIKGNTQFDTELEPVSDTERSARFDQIAAIINCTGSAANQLAIAVERKLFDSGKTVIRLDTAESPENQISFAQLLKEKGLIVVTENLETVPSDTTVTADSESEIHGQLGLV
ncbi:sulfate adenylyltransferase subunit 1 [Oleiphilus messinensis]|uniref:Sulfate adenylyltransferase subunit 1 n=1 Tax=Oleiphilus messinensis TaxID=141451 RepID=A0A1Y0I8Y6_9GAMM|nr:sulfate adenylyltransferase subunit CysN [Oleiphilus messinensis]ARU55945.1 sulfate adenylyltransferase subunit 1 [Oleiphilus messinensis]